MNKCGLFPAIGGMAAICAVLLGSASHSFAQTEAQASGNWNTPATWTAGVPTFSLPAVIDGDHTVTIDQSGMSGNLVTVGSSDGETGTLNITAGDLFLFDEDSVTEPNATAIILGGAAGGTGHMTMTGGQVFISEDLTDTFDSGDLTIGQFGTGTATISGGIFTASDEVFVARDGGSSGTLTVTGTGTLNAVRRNMLIGFGGANVEEALPGGQGEVNVSGSGQVSIAGTLFMGFGDGNAENGLPGASGDLNVSESGTVTVTGWMQTGFGLGTNSVINQSGGTVNVGGLLVHAARGQAVYNHTGGALTADIAIIGDGVGDTPAHGTYNISGGATVDTDLIFWVGAWGRSQGFVNQDGGTINAGALTVGRDGSGEYHMSAGVLNVKGTDGAPGNNHLIVGQVGNADENIAKGSGVFHQSGGTVTVKTGVFLGDFDHSEGVYKISGGTLTVDGTGSHVPVDYLEESFIGDFSVGGALASNALVDRVEPDGTNGFHGQALGAKGTFIVSGSDATINIARNFLANPADKSEFRRAPFEPNGDNSATLVFEIFDNSGTSLINVGGVADLDGAVIDLDLMGGFAPSEGTTFDLIKASSFGATGTGTTQNVGDGKGFSLATEDTGGWNLEVVAGGGFETLRATFLGLVGLPGDFNNDGTVDGRDFLAWQRGNSPNPSSAGDLALWQDNYGAGALAAVAAVPEPNTVVMLLILAAASAATHRTGTSRSCLAGPDDRNL